MTGRVLMLEFSVAVTLRSVSACLRFISVAVAAAAAAATAAAFTLACLLRHLFSSLSCSLRSSSCLNVSLTHSSMRSSYNMAWAGSLAVLFFPPSRGKRDLLCNSIFWGLVCSTWLYNVTFRTEVACCLTMYGHYFSV